MLGNTALLIAHRQRVPSSAELIAEVAGTQGSWSHTRRTGAFSTPAGAGTRTRNRAFHVHPDELKALDVGEAVVIGAVERPTRVRVMGPGARR